MTPNIATCGTCTLCCKVMAVPELSKPRDQWCGKCDKRGGGCTVYETRPQSCREFECLWLQSQSKEGMRRWPMELRPDRSHVVLATTHGDEPGVVAHVDPGYPDAWRAGAMGSALAGFHRSGKLVVIIACGDKRKAFFPDGKRVAFIDRENVDVTTIVRP